ncbi:hypothetical protein MWH06_02385 [Wolbachia pipientis]|nr:hypothetical protein MWH06_02385 [Wolbachia pipientis]
MFAVAPYAQFLASVAALSVGLPFIIGGAIFSAVIIALSYKAISKNKIIAEKDVQLAEKVEKISKKDAQLAKEEDKVQAQKQTISGQNDQLTKKEVEVKAKEEENSKQKIEINKKNEEIDNQKKEIEELKHKKTLVPQAMKNIKKASDDERDTETPSPENQPAKEGNGQSWGAWAWQNKSKIGAGVAWLTYVAANVGLDIAGNSSSAVGNPVNSAEMVDLVLLTARLV